MLVWVAGGEREEKFANKNVMASTDLAGNLRHFCDFRHMMCAHAGVIWFPESCRLTQAPAGRIITAEPRPSSMLRIEIAKDKDVLAGNRCWLQPSSAPQLDPVS